MKVVIVGVKTFAHLRSDGVVHCLSNLEFKSAFTYIFTRQKPLNKIQNHPQPNWCRLCLCLPIIMKLGCFLWALCPGVHRCIKVSSTLCLISSYPHPNVHLVNHAKNIMVSPARFEQLVRLLQHFGQLLRPNEPVAAITIKITAITIKVTAITI